MTGEPVREKKIQVISFDVFKDAVADDKSFTAISPYFDTSQTSNKISGLSKTQENSLVLTNKIIKIEQEAGASYTFRLLKTGEGNELLMPFSKYMEKTKSPKFWDVRIFLLNLSGRVEMTFSNSPIFLSSMLLLKLS